MSEMHYEEIVADYELDAETSSQLKALLDGQRRLIEELLEMVDAMPLKAALTVAALFVTHQMAGSTRIVEWGGRFHSENPMSPTESPDRLLARVNMVAESVGGYLSAIPRATLVGMHPIHRAAALDTWVKWLETWATEFRRARNEDMVLALDDVSPRGVANRLGVSKTYVLRVRDGRQN